MIRHLNSPLRPEPHATALPAIGSPREPGPPVLGFPKPARTTPPKPANRRPTPQLGPQNAPRVGPSASPARTRPRLMLLDNHLGRREKCIASAQRSSPTSGSTPTPAGRR
jgi:hypothetical protein